MLAVPAKDIRDCGAMDILCGVVNWSLRDITLLPLEGVTRLRFLCRKIFQIKFSTIIRPQVTSANTRLSELLLLFFPVVEAGNGNLNTKSNIND